MRLFIILGLSFAFATGCSQQNSSLVESSQKASDALGCKDMKSKVFDAMFSYVEKQESAPPPAQFKSALNDQIEKLAAEQNISNTKLVNNLKIEYGKLFDVVLLDATNAKKIQDVKSFTQLLMELEFVDISTAENIQLNSKLATQFQKVDEIAQELGVECTDGESPIAPPSDTTQSAQSRMIAGQNNVFATYYQSCEAPNVPPIDAKTPKIVGISVIGQREDGKNIRGITDLPAVQSTHPYVRVGSRTAANGCFNVYNKGMIYDYGGKPVVESGKINFFKNGGSESSKDLGVDCSGYVGSVVAKAGLRVSPNVSFRSSHLEIYSGNWPQPALHGYSCLDNVTVTPTQSILPGDIAAYPGHVLMIDQVYDDPFGIKKVSTLAGCDSMSLDNFNFTLSQSSPSINGVGVNKIVAKDYLRVNSTTMKDLFMEFAKSACKAKFQNKSIKPNLSTSGIVRHKGTPECMQPKVELVNESCVSRCTQ